MEGRLIEGPDGSLGMLRGGECDESLAFHLVIPLRLDAENFAELRK